MKQPHFTPHPVDLVVGMNVRRVRKSRRMSQEGLAEKLNLTFQQVQKYERGANRISASKLFEICQALDCAFSDILPPADWTIGEDMGTWLKSGHEVELRHPELIDTFSKLDPKVAAQLLNTAKAVIACRAPVIEGPIIEVEPIRPDFYVTARHNGQWPYAGESAVS